MRTKNQPAWKTSFDTRPPRHDDLVAELLSNIPSLVEQTGWDYLERAPEVFVEHPCGRGYVDLALFWKFICQNHVGARPRRSDSEFWSKRGVIVEVKSELENWSAGDVIRQLKGYRENFDVRAQYRVRCNEQSCDACGGHSVLALFSARPLSQAEWVLFDHEHVLIIEPAWRLPGIEREILDRLVRNPGASTNAIFCRISAKDRDKRVALEKLETEGKVISKEGPMGRLYYPVDGESP